MFTSAFILLGLVLIGYFFIVVGQMVVDSDQYMREKYEKRAMKMMSKMTKIRTKSLSVLRQKWLKNNLASPRVKGLKW
jgi:hypothetical protein